MRYQRCYEILGIDPGCDWRALRLAYRRRVHACHPDRADARDSRQFTDLVRAWRLLADYQRHHGCLPDPDEQVNDSRLPQPEPSPARMPAAARFDPPPQATNRWHVLPVHCHAVIAGFLAVVGIAVANSLPLKTTSSSAVPSGGTLTLGMRPEQVLDLQGVPRFTYGSVWFYGDSGIVFADGCVVGWEDRPPYALLTREHVRRADRKDDARTACEPGS